jgi:hypothetical protein
LNSTRGLLLLLFFFEKSSGVIYSCVYVPIMSEPKRPKMEASDDGSALSITDMPSEIIKYIMTRCKTKDVVSLAATCRTMHHTLQLLTDKEVLERNDKISVRVCEEGYYAHFPGYNDVRSIAELNMSPLLRPFTFVIDIDGVIPVHRLLEIKTTATIERININPGKQFIPVPLLKEISTIKCGVMRPINDALSKCERVSIAFEHGQVPISADYKTITYTKNHRPTRHFIKKALEKTVCLFVTESLRLPNIMVSATLTTICLEYVHFSEDFYVAFPALQTTVIKNCETCRTLDTIISSASDTVIYLEVMESTHFDFSIVKRCVKHLIVSTTTCTNVRQIPHENLETLSLKCDIDGLMELWGDAGHAPSKLTSFTFQGFHKTGSTIVLPKKFPDKMDIFRIHISNTQNAHNFFNFKGPERIRVLVVKRLRCPISSFKDSVCDNVILDGTDARHVPTTATRKLLLTGCTVHSDYGSIRTTPNTDVYFLSCIDDHRIRHSPSYAELMRHRSSTLRVLYENEVRAIPLIARRVCFANTSMRWDKLYDLARHAQQVVIHSDCFIETPEYTLGNSLRRVHIFDSTYTGKVLDTFNELVSALSAAEKCSGIKTQHAEELFYFLKCVRNLPSTGPYARMDRLPVYCKHLEIVNDNKYGTEPDIAIRNGCCSSVVFHSPRGPFRPQRVFLPETLPSEIREQMIRAITTHYFK